jgi:hypothetical protein
MDRLQLNNPSRSSSLGFIGLMVRSIISGTRDTVLVICRASRCKPRSLAGVLEDMRSCGRKTMGRIIRARGVFVRRTKERREKTHAG